MIYIVTETSRGYEYCNTKVLKAFKSEESAKAFVLAKEKEVADDNQWCYENGLDEVIYYELIVLPLEDL